MFVVDGREGLVPADEEIAQPHPRRSARPAMLAVNKTDDRRARGARCSSSISSAFEPVIEIAAEHGDGVAELLDEIVDAAARCRRRGESRPANETAVAIVGRPNVGKSSLVNRLLREERVMVSEHARDDARYGRRRAPVAQAAVSASSTRRACAGRAASPAADRSRR